jgi:hypothetical protein
VSRLLLLLVLALCVWYYFPETRSMLSDAASPILVPIRKWSAEEEMAQIGRNVVEHERLTGQVPSGSAWLEWLEYRYPEDGMRRDPWGSVYQLDVTRDSVAVISLGPDRVRLTEDDFQVSTARGR